MPSAVAHRLERCLGWLVEHRAAGFVLACVLTACAVPLSRRLQFDQSIEALFAQDNRRLVDFRESRALFGGDELILVAWRDPELFDSQANLFRPDRLKVVAELAGQLSHVPGVRAESTQDLATLVGRAQGMARLPGLGALEQRTRELARGMVLGNDNFTTAVVLRLVPLADAPVTRAETIRHVRQICGQFQQRTGLEPAVVGEPVQVHDMFEYVEQDGGRLGVWSTVLLLGVILVLFRNLRWTLVPLAVVWATVYWTRAGLVLLGLRLSMVSSMLTSLVTIVGVATVIHIVVRFQELRPGRSAVEALKLAITQLAPAIFWTCATTAGGFAAQLSSHIQPVASFGLMMTLGTLLVLPAMALIVPGGGLSGPGPVDPRPVPGGGVVSRALAWLARWVDRRPGQVWGLLGVLLLATVVGCSRLTVETDFSRNFRPDSPILKSMDFVEANLGGAGAWELNFPAPAALDDAFVNRVRDLARQLRELRDPVTDTPALTKVLAYSDGIDLVPRVPFVVPTLAAQGRLLAQFQPEFAHSLYNPDAGRMRLLLRSSERQRSERKLALIDQVETVARQVFPIETEAERPVATGLHVLLAYLTDSLLGDQWISFFSAAACMAVMMSIAQRSVRVGLLSLIPNLLAIGAVVAVMGWLNLPINIGTAMIASVAMGLTIDSSIHYLAGLRRELELGDGFSAALQRTQQDVGSALLYANLALVAGFLVLTASNFIPLVYFGILSSVAMLGGLLGNLVVLPLLLRATGGVRGADSADGGELAVVREVSTDTR
jgi:predicted RND superfamily exporter protein